MCNSLLQESWGEEETLHQLPYKCGAPFEMLILVQEDVFKVSKTVRDKKIKKNEWEVSTQMFNMPSPVGGSQWRSPAGLQAQNATEQGRHIFYFGKRQGARNWIHSKLSKYVL